MRRAHGAFRPDRLEPGRAVELRRGYSTGDRLFRSVGAVVVADALPELVRAVPFSLVIPDAETADDAVRFAAAILGPEPGPFVAFECVPVPSEDAGTGR